MGAYTGVVVGGLPWDPHYGLVTVYSTKQLAVDIGESKLGDLNA